MDPPLARGEGQSTVAAWRSGAAGGREKGPAGRGGSRSTAKGRLREADGHQDQPEEAHRGLPAREGEQQAPGARTRSRSSLAFPLRSSLVQTLLRVVSFSVASLGRSRWPLGSGAALPPWMQSSPRLLQNRHVNDAIVLSQSHPKKALKFVHLALKEARARAVDEMGMDPSKLVVQRALVGKGTYLKRVLPHARGRAGRMVRYR